MQHTTMIVSAREHSLRKDGQMYFFRCQIDAPRTDRKSCGTKPPLALFGPEVVVSVPSDAFAEVTIRLEPEMRERHEM